MPNEIRYTTHSCWKMVTLKRLASTCPNTHSRITAIGKHVMKKKVSGNVVRAAQLTALKEKKLKLKILSFCASCLNSAGHSISLKFTVNCESTCIRPIMIFTLLPIVASSFITSSSSPYSCSLRDSSSCCRSAYFEKRSTDDRMVLLKQQPKIRSDGSSSSTMMMLVSILPSAGQPSQKPVVPMR